MLIKECERLLGANGDLAEAIPSFVVRDAQVVLSMAIATAIENQSILVAEAGTGTGKTFAYLVPSLLSGKKAVISTATKTLQDQLFEKDLPLLKRALNSSIRVQNLKGRTNYLCKYRLDLHAQGSRFLEERVSSEMQIVREKLPRLKRGDCAELTEINEDSPVWPYITSTEDNCLNTDCPHYNGCFFVQARRRAMDADIVIINHALFFADSRLKEAGLGGVLPGVSLVVFDEAHKLPDMATDFFGEHQGTRQLLESVDDLLKIWPILDLPNRPLKQLRHELEQTLSAMVAALHALDEKINWETIVQNISFYEAWNKTLSLVDAFIECIDTAQLEAEEFLHARQRLNDAKALMLRFNEPSPAMIRWVERFKHSLVFHLTPFDVAQAFNKHLHSQSSAFVFTSATLTMQGSFDCFTKPLGLEQAETLMVESPFNYAKQALLYLPRGLPDPHDLMYYEALIERVAPIIQAYNGRCFFLFTSHKALKFVADRLSSILKFPLLVQGEEAKSILLARFRSLGNAVLLGTATFWEGVDVKGEALSCVIIDKLPFPNPSDPVVKGKSAYLNTKGMSGFHGFSLPAAVLALKQGVGRLIRDVDDRGVLVIADPRLTGRAYGQSILASLPFVLKTRDLEKVLIFIQKVKSNYETACH